MDEFIKHGPEFELINVNVKGNTIIADLEDNEI
jgi:hypothetical protein